MLTIKYNMSYPLKVQGMTLCTRPYRKEGEGGPAIRPEKREFAMFPRCPWWDEWEALKEAKVFSNFLGTGIYKILSSRSDKFSNSSKGAKGVWIHIVINIWIGELKSDWNENLVIMNIIYRWSYRMGIYRDMRIQKSDQTGEDSMLVIGADGM